ncbi:MAG TPA: DUF1203 domain-containing protein [Flavitalea sp.]|nr:DUF1203 domain-containing protein [Flavitalea sp.]
MNNFQIKSLEASEFSNLFELDQSGLQKIGAIKMIVDKKPGFPCRVSLEDAEIGEEVMLLPYQYHKTKAPYRSTGPVFVRKNAITARLMINEIPKMLQHRLLSLRAYDRNGMMKESSVAEGHALKDALEKIFINPDISYIHIHNAKAGCYNCEVVKA